MVRGICTQVRESPSGTLLARPSAIMEHVIHDESEAHPILLAPIVTIATTLALVIFAALLGH